MANRDTRNTGRASTFLNVSDDKVYEAIRKRAYELYCKRGHANGNDMKDWLEAERQVKKEMNLAR
ncbi:MAG: DUF2934 domain-containing protein [Proteobacteria bacterium]|nr:DUF2934 domain-containing protein [Pseudomonadota bacterium]